MTQIRSSSLRRLALPLGLSLAAHALLIGLAWLGPSCRHEQAAAGGSFSPLSVFVSFGRTRDFTPVLKRPAPAEPPDDDEFDPQLTGWEPKGADVRVIDVSPPSAGVGAGNNSPGGNAPPPPGTASSSLIAAPPQARQVAYVIDRSISMGASGALTRAKAELAASLRGLSSAARFQVIVYNGFAYPLLSGGWRTPDAATLAEVERRLDDLDATGGTDHVRALRQAMLARPDLLFWVTDADELTEAGVREVTLLNAGRAGIHVVELAAGHADRGSLLKRLAEDNRGRYRRAAPR